MPQPPRPRPQPIALEGRYARLEPLAAAHAPDLYDACSGAGARERFAWLADEPPRSVEEMRAWIDSASSKADPLFHAVIDRAIGRAAGRQALMRIAPEHGAIEIGNILWGPAIARTRVATEAFFLAARHVFDDLGYRRLEWKCNDLNGRSKAAALRFGFQPEGLFRQHMWVKGASRDTAWFAILDADWPAIRDEIARWLAPGNFEPGGRQRTPLQLRR